jgi:hypothetical protein
MFAQQEPSLSRRKVQCIASPAVALGSSTSVGPQPLNFFQRCVLTLIELDPCLTYDRQRSRLREIAKLFHPLLGHDKVGRSLARLKVLNREGALITEAFAPQSDEPPDLQHAIQVINELGRRCGWAEKSPEDLQVRRVRVLRLLGHVVPPRMNLSGDDSSP